VSSRRADSAKWCVANNVFSDVATTINISANGVVVTVVFAVPSIG
jgi:hypothetical protein